MNLNTMTYADLLTLQGAVQAEIHSRMAIRCEAFPRPSYTKSKGKVWHIIDYRKKHGVTLTEARYMVEKYWPKGWDFDGLDNG